MNSRAQDFKTVHDGVEYAEVTKEISGLPVHINLLRLDLTKVRLDIHHAADRSRSMERTSSIAARLGAIAAINGGFFRLDKSDYAGEAAGVLRIDGKFLSEPKDHRTAIFLTNGKRRTTVDFGTPKLKFDIAAAGKSFAFDGIDRELKDDDAVVFTPEFGAATLPGRQTLQVVFAGRRVVRVIGGSEAAAIPGDGSVLALSGRQASAARAFFRVGQKAKINVTDAPRTADDTSELASTRGVEDITNGVPRLIRDGKIDITWQEEKASRSFFETRHPRTAVAKLKGGKFLMITVDGRSESSGGIGLEDLAEYLLSLGATDAMNLDGGGSTTMVLDGRVVNHPSDKDGERKIGDALIVTLRHHK